MSLEAIVGGLDPHELSRRLAESMVAERGVPPDRNAPMGEAARVMVSTMIRCLVERRALNSLELEAIRGSSGPERPRGATDTLALNRMAGRLIQRRALDGIAAGQMTHDARARAVQTVTSSVSALMHQVAAAIYEAQVAKASSREAAVADDGGALAGLLEGGLSEDVAGRKAATAGIARSPAHVAIVLDEIAPISSEAASSQQVTFKPLREAVFAALASSAWRPVIEPFRDELVAVVQTDRQRSNEELAEHLGRELALSERGTRAIAGVGTVVPTLDRLSESYGSACRAMSVLRLGESLGPVLTYERSIPYLLLLADPSEAVGAIRRCLLPLIRHDERHGGDLVVTLEAYLEGGCNAMATARALQVHRHTVNTRIGRIGRITGFDVEDRGAQMLYEIALYASRLFPGLG